MLAQIFVLPGIDSIGSFTLLFLGVTCLGAWIMSSGPRLSYFGLQLLVAFYLINVSEFTIQTSLSIARDRVMGIVLGLIMMWLAFDGLWSARAIVGMKKALTSLLRSLAKLARDPTAGELQVAINQSYAVRETINSRFNDIRSLGDGVLFEFGPTRHQDLAARTHILALQPQLRLLFLTRVTLFKYRLQLPGFELPDAIRRAQQEFDACLARTLESMAKRLDGQPTASAPDLEVAFARLQAALEGYASADPDGKLGQRVKTFAVLSERITRLALSFNKAIQTEASQSAWT